jgi:prevent-host-death family protein
MEALQARLSASISELKKNPSALIAGANGEAIAILNHNRPTAYLVPAATYEALIQGIAPAPGPTRLADLLAGLPAVTSFQGDPVALKRTLRDEW